MDLEKVSFLKKSSSNLKKFIDFEKKFIQIEKKLFIEFEQQFIVIQKKLIDLKKNIHVFANQFITPRQKKK